MYEILDKQLRLLMARGSRSRLASQGPEGPWDQKSNSFLVQCCGPVVRGAVY